MSKTRLVLFLIIVAVWAINQTSYAIEPADAVVRLAVGVGDANNGDEINNWGLLAGFIISDGDQRSVISAAHAVSHNTRSVSKEFWAIFRSQGRPEKLKLIGYDHRLDVALFNFVNVDANKNRPALELGSSDNLVLGDILTSIGHPKGFGWTISSAEIVNLMVNRNDSSSITAPQMVIYDGSINRGVSGGPLLNKENKVVAMSVQAFDSGAGLFSSGGGSALGAAVAVDDIKYVLPKLMVGGEVRHPPIGVRFDNESYCLDWDFDKLKIKRPAVIGGLVALVVDGGSVEDKSGLQAGDVIVSCDDKKLKNACDLYRQIYFRHDFGDEIKLKIDRYGKNR